MIEPQPRDRYSSFDKAVEAITHRNLHVEVARDSFTRILDKEDEERKFFFDFYRTLLGMTSANAEETSRSDHETGVRQVFLNRRLPPFAKRPPRKWQMQFDKLKEAIVFLFTYNLLRETQGRTILSSIAEMHHKYKGMRREYYDHFGKTLIATVLKHDNGIDPDDLQTAWERAIAPGLEYLKTAPAGRGSRPLPDGIKRRNPRPKGAGRAASATKGRKQQKQ
jgi:hypothetical protein